MKNVSFKMLGLAVAFTVVVCVGGAASYAKYVSKVESKNNVITSAKFNIALSDKTQLDNAKFSLDKFSPYSDPEEKLITINKNDTEVAVQYKLSVKVDASDKELFDGTTPIKMELLRKVGTEFKTVVADFMNNPYILSDVNGDTALVPKDIEEFKVKFSWVTTSDENDTKYQGKTGKFDVIFQAEQVKVVEPTPIPKEILQITRLNVVDKNSNINIGYETNLPTIEYYKNDKGLRVIKFDKIPGVNLSNITLTQIETEPGFYTSNWDDSKFQIYTTSVNSIEFNSPLNGYGQYTKKLGLYLKNFGDGDWFRK